MILRSARVVLPDGERAASIHVEDGRIVHIGDERRVDHDFGGLTISPGIVDTHVHINEPGRTEWEGFDTATRAAAAGGVTTIVDMPLNSIPATTTVAALDAKRAAAVGRIHVDVAFWGGVVPGNAGALDVMAREFGDLPREPAGPNPLEALIDAGVRGFKCFLVPSGVDEFPQVGASDLAEAMPILARRGVPLLVHAEAPHEMVDVGLGIVDYAKYLASRPPAAEVSAIELMVHLAREFGTRVHIVHVACAEAVEVIARAKADGVPITAETCPHYLTFAAEEIPDGATEFKCAPPIRAAFHRDALWDGLRLGVLDFVATDHSPSPPSMKPRGDFAGAWGGIASLELSIAAVWTGGSGRRWRPPEHPHKLAPTFVPWNDGRLTPSICARVLSAAPARLAGLDDRKGRIAVGYDADLIVWNPEAEFSVDPARLQQRHKLTPYAGRRLRGVVKTTFLRGERIWDDGALTAAARGQLL